MSFLKRILIGVLLFSSLFSEGVFQVQGVYDLDGDGLREALVLNGTQSSAIWIEISGSTIGDTLWQYHLPSQGMFNDAEVTDINGDGHIDIIAVAELFPGIKGDQNWLYVFLGHESGFSGEPLTLGHQSLDLGTVRPSNLALIPGDPPQLVVAFGTPIREAMLFYVSFPDETISLSNNRMLKAPMVSNGYGPLYVGGFISGGDRCLAMFSPEGNELKTVIFGIDQNFEPIYSDLLLVGDARGVVGTGIQGFQSTRSADSGLIIPYGTDDILLLKIENGKLILSETNLSDKGAYHASSADIAASAPEIVKTRIETEVYPLKPLSANYLSMKEEKRGTLLPPQPLVNSATPLKPGSVFGSKDETSMPYEINTFYKRIEKPKPEPTYLDSLSPTLGDYLLSIEKEKSQGESEIEKTSVPEINTEMESVTWAQEAGFEQVGLGEYLVEEKDNLISPIPSSDIGVKTFTETVEVAIAPKLADLDTTEIEKSSEKRIDLYYMLAMTPAKETEDRYIFNGEAPFGVSVNQIPADGTPTHFQHGISANLANLHWGDTYDFAYSLRNAVQDSVTTLTMVHDIQTNVVLISITPNRDSSLSKSYQPEAFDPKLFEFPEYFFEGFPSSLDMNFSEKLIRFSFAEELDSIHHGIYLSSTTPSKPPQSLAVFLDEGKLQSIRGEVIVRVNGSKKITTEFDLAGKIEPSVMFSRLIQESFSDELKVKLLQGGSLEEPLFGRDGKLPKITKEPRLPDVQFDQSKPEIPVAPKQSNVPDTQEQDTKAEEEKISSELKVSEPQESEPTPDIPSPDDNSLLPASNPEDTLKLEQSKEPVTSEDVKSDSLDEKIPIAPKQSNVPDAQEQNTETEEDKTSSELKVSEPQESDPTPDTTKPETAEPETTEPETTKPETAEPETAEPETTEPETAEPGTTKANDINNNDET